ncbi:MAG: adenylosuccinate synthase [Zhenhengia sp.]|jgi:adenylosuccinate synthase|uniref:adenylosuccinate synthase n=1 Tax=Zhenhengia sp. TaxID=2944208 RepID=UPI002913D3A9|nr:adenylosuccinate synthase [Clostridiales bacterium]MDU6975113.1 adenylosuccinate synthase [Clostridiales bacterium]
MVSAIVGGNWGDEGKGKITDLLAGNADIIVRFQGGANAGHTIINEYGKFALHLLPSGVFRKDVVNIIGQGVALDLSKLFGELDGLTSRGVPMPNILVSDRAQILMPYHILFDQLEEARLGDKSFGSTKSGIAPFYSDKYLKIGVQVGEMFDDEILMERLEKVCEIKNQTIKSLYQGAELLDPKAVFDEVVKYRERLEPMIANIAYYLNDAIKAGKHILLEGQLGALKDTDNGIYPYVTSSSPLAGFATVGASIPPHEIKQIVTVVKAYSSAVGAGAFVSEIFGEEAEELRKRGGDCGEYGATTGRPRRMGWFDVVATKYGCMLHGTTDVALSLLDVLGYLDKIPVCIGYEIDGVVTDVFPTTPQLNKAKPVLTYLDGWKCDISGIKNYDDLPENAKKYVEFVEEKLGYPVTLVSNGPKRDDIILRNFK